MTAMHFKAFLSCSLHADDKPVVDFFRSYIESFGFDMEKYDYQEPVRLCEAVKNKIRDCDCLVAVA